jgi:hypothetical protein
MKFRSLEDLMAMIMMIILRINALELLAHITELVILLLEFANVMLDILEAIAKHMINAMEKLVLDMEHVTMELANVLQDGPEQIVKPKNLQTAQTSIHLVLHGKMPDIVLRLLDIIHL